MRIMANKAICPEFQLVSPVKNVMVNNVPKPFAVIQAKGQITNRLEVILNADERSISFKKIMINKVKGTVHK